MEQKAVVGSQLNIPLNVKIEREKLSAVVTDQSGNTIQEADIIEKQSYEYTITFVPHKAGKLNLEIKINGQTKQKVPLNISETQTVSVTGGSKVSNALVGSEVQFKLHYASVHNSSQVNATFKDEYGSILAPTTVEILGNGHFAIKYTPTKAGTYIAKVGIDGVGTLSNEFLIEASNPPGVKLIEGGDGLATQGKPFKFKLDAQKIKKGDIEVNVKTPSGKTQYAEVVESGSGIFELVYTPNELGTHSAEIKISGGLVSNPLKIYSRPAVKWISFPTGEKLVGKDLDIAVQVNDVSVHNIYCLIKSSDGIQYKEHFNQEGSNQFNLKWKPTTGGHYTAQVYLDGQHICEPISFHITNPVAEFQSGNTSRGKVGDVFTLNVSLDNISNRKMEAPVKDSNGLTVDYGNITDKGNGNIQINYSAKNVGTFFLTLTLDGTPIKESTVTFVVQ